MRLRPRTPTRSRRVRWIAWSVGLACLGYAVLPAGAATDKIVVDEFLLRCADARPDGAFVELVATGPGQTFDAALGVRLLGPSGSTIADLPGVFASRAGQPWPEGRHFLIATALFEPLTGVAPDTVFTAPPASNSGSIVLYRKSGTTLTVLNRVEYSSTSGLAPTPPPGRSATSTIPGLFHWSPDPSPTRSDGVLARAPDCFADPHRSIRITELATQCGGGNPSGAFVEIAPSASGQSLDPDLSLRAFDHSGALLFDVPLGFGTLQGPWSTSRTWLVGDSLLRGARGELPDLVWPAPLDAAGGRVVLHGLDATGAEVVLSDVEYGTPSLPAPPSGASLVWDSFTGRYVQRSPSTPTDFGGAAHLPQGCAPPSTIRIRELLTDCSQSSEPQSYIELMSGSSDERFDSTLVLVIHDAADMVYATVPAGFGSRGGTSWPVATNWLIATSGMTNDQGALPDALLPVTLDAVAGRIELQRRLGGPTGRMETIQSLRWGGTQIAPPPGQAIRRFSDTDYRLQNPPQPTTSAGQVLRCPQASDTAIVIPVKGMEVCTGCWDGSRRGQYVRLSLVVGVRLDQSFVLRLYDRHGVLLGTTPRLFNSSRALKATDERSWLVVDPEYPAPIGSFDALLPAPLDSVAGTVAVVSVRSGIERASVEFTYGPAELGSPRSPAATALPIVPPGYGFRTYPFTSLVYPEPVSFSGTESVIPGCHFSGTLADNDPHIGEVFVACSDRDSSMQYIEITGVDPDRAPDPRLSLYVFDQSGTLRQLLTPLVPANLPPELRGTGPRTLLVGGPAFQATTGLAPDRTLAGSLPVSGGTMALIFRDRVLGDVSNLQVVGFLPGTTPQLGRSLVLTKSGGQLTSRHPVALRLNGDSFEIPAPCRDTAVAIPMVLQKLALGCFDGDPRGQVIQLVSSGTEDTLTSAFALQAYDHTGALAGEVSPAFGGMKGFPAQVGRTLLIARADAALPVPLDAPLGFALDSLGGKIALVERRPSGDRTSWSVDYPASDPRGFLMGSVRQLVNGTTWSPGSSLLTDWAFRSGVLQGCHYGTGSLPAIQVRGVLGACGDGKAGPSWVELTATSNDSVLAGLELQVLDEKTNMTVPLFPRARAFDRWPAGRSLLLATDAFAATMGFTPDVRLPSAFGSGTGEISVRLADPTQEGRIELTSEALDFGSHPEPGRALTRSAGPFVSTSTPTPATFDGVTHTLPPDCFVQTGSPDDVRLSGVLLACASGGTTSQYVQVERTSVVAGRAPDLRVRLLDHLGATLGERDHLFPAGSVFWGPVNSLVIGGLEFQTAFGFAPDATLPAAMDTLGGTIQLVRAEAGVDRTLSELRYGRGGVAVPERSHALVLDHGTWRPEPLPHPFGFKGDGEISTFCRLPCEAQRFQLSLSGPQPATTTAADYSDSYSNVSFSLARAEFDVRSHFAHAELLMSDRYSLTGAAAPETLGLFIDVLEAHKDTCIRNACFHASRRLHLFVNGTRVDSLLATVSGQGRLQARVPFDLGQTVFIQVLATADGLLNPDLLGRVSGRLRFESPPQGTRVTSCGGYDSNQSRVVLGAEWSQSPHTIAIDWRVNAQPGFTANVERLDESEPAPTWRLRAVLPAEPSGVLRYTDNKVSAENTYRYRLTWSDAFGSYTSDEVRIHAPRLPSFALLGALPNPSHGALRVAFELPDPAGVHVELFDLLGRRVREVRTSLGSGPQSVALDQGRRLAPGLYQVRLEAGERRARTTVVVLP